MYSLLLPLIIWCFLPGFRELWQTYSSPWMYENAIVAGIIVFLYGVTIFKRSFKDKNNRDSPSIFISLGILAVCGLLLLNNFFGGFQILPPILAYFAIYLWLGFYLKPSFWQKSIFVFILLILTLPILERLQKFIGFPVRLITADIVSFLLQLIGVGHISNSTVIMTENYATTIDLPCSGVKSLYFGGIVLLAVYFLQQVKISIKSIILAILFFVLLFFFNIWRVFGLTYIYGVLNLVRAGDSIHVFLGIFGFVISCLFLWYGSSFLKKNEVHPKSIFHTNQNHSFIFCMIILIITGVLTNTLIKEPSKKSSVNQQTVPFSLPNATTSVVPLSDKEKTLFLNNDIIFASKYVVRWEETDLDLLLVKSTSSRSQHDPETCLQGLGYRLLNEQTNSQAKQIEIQSGSLIGTVYYWYVSKDKIITDYSQRVWEQFRQPNQEWVLVEVLIQRSQLPAQEKLNKLFEQLTSSVRSQLLL